MEYDRQGNQPQSRSFGTYLTVFVTLDPVLRPMDPPRLKFESQEKKELLQYAGEWVEGCREKFAKRPVKATVIDIKGEAVLIVRCFESFRVFIFLAL